MKTKIISIILTALQLWLLGGCVQKEVISDLQTDLINDSKSLTELYKDSIYLNIEGDLNNPENIWNNIDVYSAACERIHRCLRFEENRILWNIERSEDLKISKNIYDYIIEALNYDNNTLQDSNYVLVPMGIYYKIEKKNPVNLPRTKTPQVLFYGARELNMNICCDIIRNRPMGYLGYYIDLHDSEGWKGDGYGGLRVWNEWGENHEILSYYVSFIPNARFSELNEITTYQSNSGIESACNNQHAPLVKTLGRFYWEKKHRL